MTNGMLDVGDELYEYGNFNDSMFYTGKIDRVTKTMAFIGDRRFKRKYRDHTETLGDFSYSSKFYYLLDTESRVKLQSEQKRRALIKPLTIMIDNGRQSIKRLSNDQLERINAILAEVKE